MPLQAAPPQTSKKARRAFLKSKQQFTYTATQFRAAERRDELEERAKKIADKEERKTINKRKRKEKYSSDRAAKRRQISEGKLPPEAALGKVTASQPRLSLFLLRPKPIKLELGSEEEAESEKEAENEEDSEPDSEESIDGEVVHESTARPARDLSVESEEFEHFFSSPASPQPATMAQQMNIEDVDATKDHLHRNIIKAVEDPHTVIPKESNISPSARQALLDAQLSFSEVDFDFDILEDKDADPLEQPAEDATDSQGCRDTTTNIHLLVTPSKRKADEAGLTFVSPAKSARSALSEMSPSKVNIRAQEKPDIFSIASFASNLPSPGFGKPTASQSAAEIIAMIGTQDLEDDEFATDKENEDPYCTVDRASGKKQVESKTERPGQTEETIRTSVIEARTALVDEDIFGDEHDLWDPDLEDGEAQDDYDKDVDDATLATLVAQSPSKHKSQRTLYFTSMPPPLLFPVLKALHNTTPQKLRDLPPATQGNSFSFDDVEDDDLNSLAEKYDPNDAIQKDHSKKPSRTIPWNHPSQFPMSQASEESLSHDEEGYDYD